MSVPNKLLQPESTAMAPIQFTACAAALEWRGLCALWIRNIFISKMKVKDLICGWRALHSCDNEKAIFARSERSALARDRAAQEPVVFEVTNTSVQDYRATRRRDTVVVRPEEP